MSLVEELFQDSGTVVADTAPVTALAVDVDKDVLYTMFADAQKIIPSRDAMPILKYVKVDVVDDVITTTATDMELGLVRARRGATVDVAGTVVLPAAKMLDILRSATGPTVRLRATATRCKVTVGRTTWTLTVPSGADFPTLPTITADAVTVTVQAQPFLDALNHVKYAATNANRPGLSAVHIHNDIATGCDGSRFAQVKIGVGEFPQPLVLPLSAVERLLRLSLAGYATELDITILDRHYLITAAGTVLVITRSVHPYPDLSAALLRPALTNRHELVVDLDDLGDALNRTRITTDPDIRGVALHLAPGTLTVVSRDAAGNTTSDEMACRWVGPARTLTVNHRHLRDQYLVMAELIEAQCGAERSLTLLLGEDARTRRSPILARCGYTGAVSVIQQMHLDWSDA